MTKTRLAAALSLAFLLAPMSQAAKYRIVELPVTNEGQDTFPSAINDNGTVAVNVTSPFNVPIDLSLLDFESDALKNGLTDVESASNGNFNSTDYELLLGLIRSGDGSQSTQQIASLVGFLSSENEANYITGFDQRATPDNEFTISTNTTVKDINNAGLAVGTSEGFYNKIDYTFEDDSEATFVVQEFGSRGFVDIAGTTVGLPSPETLGGGFSEAYGINESNQVVGYGITSFFSDTVETQLTNCRSEELIDHDDDPATAERLFRGDIPVESCESTIASGLSSSATDVAQLQGLIWQLDDQGNLLDTTELGLLYDATDEENVRYYRSQAKAINDNGVAVGNANQPYIVGGEIVTQNDIPITRLYAAIFDGNEVINITPDPDSAVARSSSTISTAEDINNDNLVVGYQVKSVNGSLRTKFFVYDMNTSEMTLPTDFFLGSNSVAFDINNNGKVVGYGEIDAAITGRRTGGFIYDHPTREFEGLQSLVSCDSPYTIVQANAINDKNEIAATALYEGPAKDSTGAIILDSTGSEVIVELVTSVKLEPIEGGEVENCESPDDDDNLERQGASASWIIGLGLLILGWRRVIRS